MEKILGAITNKDKSGILISKRPIGFSYANEYICKIFGYSLGEFSSFSYLAHLMHDNDQEDNIQASMEVWNGEKQMVKITSQFRRKDGTYFTADLMMTNRPASSGENYTVMQFENITETDITFNDTKEGKMASIAAKYSNNNKSAIILANAAKGIAYANRRCNDVFGYSPKEMENLKGPAFVHSSSMAEIARKGIKVYSGFAAKECFPCTFKKKDDDNFNADLTITKHKEDGTKYLVMQLDNIVHEDTVEATS